MEEYEAAEYEAGFSYELVRGRLEVTPSPDLPHDVVLEALDDLVKEYRASHPGIFDHLSLRSRVFPGAPARQESLEPDLALFTGLRREERQSWRDLEPVLVVEVLSPGQEKKDRVRNRQLYLEVLSIREYWIVDPRRGTLLVLVRDPSGIDWSERFVPAGGRYETALFPGLIVDLSRPDLGLAELAARRLERTRTDARAVEARETLASLLQEKFGPLSSEVAARLGGAALHDLRAWIRRVLSAGSVEDVFRVERGP